MEFQYKGPLAIVSLQTVTQGLETDVAHQVDELLGNVRAQHTEVSSARAEKRKKRDLSAIQADTTKSSSEYASLFRARHYAMLGQFDLASIYYASGFSVCHELSKVRRVISQHHLFGATPVVNHFASVEKERFPANCEPIATDAFEYPLIAISQLQVNSILNAASGLHLLRPAIRVFAEKINDAVDGDPDLRGIFLDSFGWSDWTVVLYGYDYEKLLRAIYQLRTTQLQELVDRAPKSVKRHIESRLSGLKPDREGENSSEMLGLCTTYTSLGCTIEFADQCFREEVRDRRPDLSVKPPATPRTVGGEIRSHVRLSVRPGREPMALKSLRHVAKSDAPKPRFTVGRNDFSISASELCGTSEDKVPTQEFLQKLFYLRWILGGSPKIQEHKGLCWGLSPSTPKSSIMSCFTEVETQTPENNPSQDATWSSVAEIFRGASDHLAQLGGENFAIKMRKKLISKNLRDDLGDVIFLWLNSLGDEYLASSMIELTDSAMVCYRMINHLLDDDSSTKYNVEKLLTRFTANFAQSFRHRLQSSYYLCDRAEIVSEQKGGLIRFLSTIDGFVKAVLSLAGSSEDLAALTSIRYDALAKVLVDVREREGQRYGHAITLVNWTCLVHPERLRTILHELAHVITVSRSFVSAFTDPADREAIFALPVDSLDGLRQERIRELAAESFIAELCFHDDLDLYARVFISQFAVSLEGHGHSFVDCATQVVEHSVRAYLVAKILEQKLDFDRADAVRWWEQHRNLIAFSVEWTDAILAESLIEFLHQVQEWLSRERLVCEQILAGVRQTLGEANGECFTTTIKTLWKHLPSVKSSLVKGVPFLFEEPQRTKEIRADLKQRATRLASLGRQIVLFRAFLEIIDDWVWRGPNCRPYVGHSSDDGAIIFDESEQEAVYDSVYGTVFVASQKKADDYLRLRLAFVNSMWHLAETSKLSDLEAVMSLAHGGRSERIAGAS